jgi:hypothetical protein
LILPGAFAFNVARGRASTAAQDNGAEEELRMSTRLRNVLVSLVLVGLAGTLGCKKTGGEEGGTGADTLTVNDTTSMAPPPEAAPADTGMSMSGDSTMGHDSM